MATLNARLDVVEEKLEAILEAIHSLSQSCKHMDDHIEFVEDVYQKVRHPLTFITNKITGSDTPLPHKSVEWRKT